MRWPSGVALVLQGTAKRYHTPLAAKIHPGLRVVSKGDEAAVRRGWEGKSRQDGGATVSSRAETGTAVLCPCAEMRRLGSAHRAPLLEAFPAKDRAALRRAEGDGGVLAALRTGGFGLRPHLRRAICPAATTLGALGFAGFAAFRFVLEALVGEKHLLAGSKYEFSTAFGTLQDLIVEFHEPLPLAQVEQGKGRTLHLSLIHI